LIKLIKTKSDKIKNFEEISEFHKTCKQRLRRPNNSYCNEIGWNKRKAKSTSISILSFCNFDASLFAMMR